MGFSREGGATLSDVCSQLSWSELRNAESSSKAMQQHSNTQKGLFMSYNNYTDVAIYIYTSNQPQGIGDSAQGIVNAVLFIGFTRVVRRRLMEMVRGGCCRNCCREQWTALRDTDLMTSQH